MTKLSVDDDKFYEFALTESYRWDHVPDGNTKSAWRSDLKKRQNKEPIVLILLCLQFGFNLKIMKPEGVASYINFFPATPMNMLIVLIYK